MKISQNIENIIKIWINITLGEEKKKIKILENNKREKCKTQATETTLVEKTICETSSFQTESEPLKAALKSIETQTINISTEILKLQQRSKSKSLTSRSSSTKSAYSEIFSKLMGESKAKCKCKANQNSIQKKVPWDSIDPKSAAAATLNLTRDIAGFFCATLDNNGECNVLEEHLDDLLDNMEDRTRRTKDSND